ncbi:MAG: ROK family protein [Myxococcota bacterium]|nr:ROK family protein [Myxococcota bacterium]
MLRLIWAEQQLSRAEVSRKVGLSRSTVTGIVSDLIDQGLVFEARMARSRGGRPPILLQVREDFRHLVGVELGASHISAVVTDLRGRALRHAHRSVDVQGDPERAQQVLVELILQLLQEQGLSPSDLAGVGLGVPCPLSSPDQLDPNILPAWSGHAPGARLVEALGVPVLMENDANLGALAELWWGAGQGVGDFSYIKVATGVGAGHIIGGRVYRGGGGIAGEIGHTTIDIHGPPCRCGLNGCLEALVGRQSLEQRTGMSLQQILDGAALREPAALEAITEAGTALGIAVANLLNLLNPARVILGGTLTRAGDLLLEPMRLSLAQRALFTSVARSKVVLTTLGEDAVARGAATLVLEAALQDHTLLTNPSASRRRRMEVPS